MIYSYNNKGNLIHVNNYFVDDNSLAQRKQGGHYALQVKNLM
jgi:hypothetical protein